MRSDFDTLKDIPNGKPVRIFLPLLNGPDKVRARCLFEESTPPKFTLVFEPGRLPVDAIDTSQPCIISIDMGGPTVSLEAMIQDIPNPQTLEMIARKSISHEQMREFFRVDAETRVVSKAFGSSYIGEKGALWSIQGQTVDISGSGILAQFKDQPPADRQVWLEISLPEGENDTVRVLAHQVRGRQLKDGLFEVAYHFDDISTEDRDRIIGCCFVIQRKMLRLKVQVKDDHR